MVWKFATFVIAGFFSSYFMYNKTHTTCSEQSQLPETVGIAFGLFVIFCAFVAFDPDDEKAQQRFMISSSAVGSGVLINRLRMAIVNT